MGLVDLFKNKNKIEKKETLVESKEESVVEEKSLDIPKVIIDDFELYSFVGDWLGLLPAWVGLLPSIGKLSIEEILNKAKIPESNFKEVPNRFGIILKQIGIDSNEICHLNTLNKDKYSFNCHFENANDDAEISLVFADMVERGYELTIDYQNSKKTYDYDYLLDSSTDKLGVKLRYYTLENSNNGNHYMRYLSTHASYFTLTNNDFNFDITIYTPHNMEIPSEGVYTLKNEKQLEQYLLDLSFPIAIDEVYKKICELSLESPISEYPTLSLKVEKELNNGKRITTDSLLMKDGELKNFTITRDDTIVSTNDGNKFTFMFNIETSGFEEVTDEELEKETIEKFKNIQKEVAKRRFEVQQVKQLKKTVF